MSKKVTRVHFMDVSFMGFPLEDGCFLFLERCLENHEKPGDLMLRWNSELGTEPNKIQPAFVFKKKIFLRDSEKEMADPVAKHHVYIQALYSVIESEYPSTIEEAMRLAGLQVQIVYGDHKPSTHTVGFLSVNLRQFVPRDLFSLKKATEWENLIFRAHATYIGKSTDDAKTEYLDIVKQWPFYGTTFHPPCKTVGNKRILKKVIIGVNTEGILLLKRDSKELVSTHPYTDIFSWASSATTFSFEFGSLDSINSQKYIFETKNGNEISAIIQTYIDILLDMLKNGELEGDEDD